MFIIEIDTSDDNKAGIVVSARVHPGESNSSWIMKGLVDFLSGPTNTAKVSAIVSISVAVTSSILSMSVT